MEIKKNEVEVNVRPIDDLASPGLFSPGLEKPLVGHSQAIDATLVDEERFGSTHRGLKSRHVQLIALGGCIGTGLFVGSGATLSLTGPAPLFMGFLILSIITAMIMNALSEMAVFIPIPGASVPYYINRFFEPSLAFASGWNYWYSWSMTVGTEVVAASLIIDYWQTGISPAVWITLILALIISLNIFMVAVYGEAEFWFASVKVIALLAFIVLGVVIFFGGGPNHQRLGFYYWENPGAFKPFAAKGATGNFAATWVALIMSGFSFIFSPELVTTAAGEAQAPRRNIPKASKRFAWRIAILYGLGALVISVIVPSNDPGLLKAVTDGSKTASASPWVLGIKNAGIPVFDHLINAVILSSAASSANAFLYASSRTLYSLSISGQAPAIFMRCSRHGVPWVAVLASATLPCLAYLSLSKSSELVFHWMMNLTTSSGYIAWVTVLMAYLRFRSALIRQGQYETRPYKTPLQPYTSWFCLGFVVLLTLTSGFMVFLPGAFNVSSFLTAYVTIPLFFVLYFGHKIVTRTPWARPLDQVDLVTGKAEADEMERLDKAPVPRNFVEAIWFWLA